MATYKVIQDIEAEDHILGPLTLRQFIFALIAVFLGYLSFLFITKGVAFLAIFFLPPALFFGFFAIPFGRDQPTEIWFLAKLRFWFKPRKRIWDQSGIKELVTITVPKKIERRLTNGLSEHEVASRLKVLANTLDSRGWAIKNSTISAPMQPAFAFPGGDSDVSDRLIDINTVAPATAGPGPSADDVPDETDILDENSAPAQQLGQMINESSRAHRQQLINQMNSPVVPASSASNQWFMPQVDEPSASTPVNTVYAPDVAPQVESVQDEKLVSQIKAGQQARQVSSNNLRTLQPIADNNQPVSTPQPVSQPMAPPLTDTPDPAILSLANSGDNLTVETIAHEAKKKSEDDGLGQDEVVISLH